jgi:Domain of Unknown Function (DUF928)
MVRKKSLFQMIAVSAALPVGLIISAGFFHTARSNPLTNSWEISQAFQSPNRGTPPGGAGGATRGNSCLGNKKVVPLVPSNQIGLTLQENPTYLVYVPENLENQVTLTLLSRQGEKENIVGEPVSFTAPSKGGIISISLPATEANKLKVDQLYRWEIQITCDPDDPSGNLIVQGWVQRVDKKGAFANLGNNSTPADYAKTGVWYEALAGAAKRRQDERNNPAAIADWEKLLNSVGLNEVAKAPLVDCCKVENNTDARN